jgi:hypothetical protein
MAARDIFSTNMDASLQICRGALTIFTLELNKLTWITLCLNSLHKVANTADFQMWYLYLNLDTAVFIGSQSNALRQ